MTIIYIKTGDTSRLEWTPQSRTLIEISESGQARLDAGTFVTESRDPNAGRSGRVAPEELESFATRIENSIPNPVRLDRLVVAAGSATHRTDAGSDARSWSDSNARCFASLSLPDTPLQLEIDLGAASLAGIDVQPLRDAAGALQMYRGDTTTTGNIRLAPVVSAALWRALAAAEVQSAGARVFQSSHPEFCIDGNGLPIKPHFEPPWPNVYRPSYRGAPVAMPFHLDVETGAFEAGQEPTVVALLEPLHLVRNVLLMVGLCMDGDASFRIVVALSPVAWLQSIEGAGERRTWFPFGAGSWGRDVRIVR